MFPPNNPLGVAEAGALPNRPPEGGAEDAPVLLNNPPAVDFGACPACDCWAPNRPPEFADPVFD